MRLPIEKRSRLNEKLIANPPVKPVVKTLAWLPCKSIVKVLTSFALKSRLLRFLKDASMSFQERSMLYVKGRLTGLFVVFVALIVKVLVSPSITIEGIVPGSNKMP